MWRHLEELARANIASHSTKEPTVQMGSYVCYKEVESDTVREVRLVYPDQSDSRQGHISILTPVGAALIGLSASQTIKWRDRRGNWKALTVLSIQPEPVPGPSVAH